MSSSWSEFHLGRSSLRAAGWGTGGYSSRSKASSSRGGRGQDSFAAVALAMASVTVVLPIPQLFAIDCLLWPHDQARRRISRKFRMVTLFCGILSPLNLTEGWRIPELPRDYIKRPVGMPRNAGRLHYGMPVGIPPERRSASERNAGRHGPEYAPNMEAPYIPHIFGAEVTLKLKNRQGWLTAGVASSISWPSLDVCVRYAGNEYFLRLAPTKAPLNFWAGPASYG